jgi:hypothetical protein
MRRFSSASTSGATDLCTGDVDPDDGDVVERHLREGGATEADVLD